ncbi:GNAT family N-acetyltransferase [Microbacterium lacticum]|nr:GNAT family N-acetyltransferase [Microbacterium lacticum]MBF9336462.1 GNAT family N-acetyltransferase [Microbacterium lacticum]
MHSTTDVVVRPVASEDEVAWKRLYHGYRDFYKLSRDEEIVNRVWEWVTNGQYSIQGLLVADGDGNAIGLANIRAFARPSSGSMGIYLDDLYTDPAFRGRGAATALLREVRQIAGAQDATVVRWITSADNTTARSVYDQNAVLTKWVTYDMTPE